MAYGIFESTNIKGRNFSFQSPNDVENGTLVCRGPMITKDIYQVAFPTAANMGTEKMFIVGNPAWSPDNSSIINQNENEFINKAGKAFRAYELLPNDKFTVADYSIDMGGTGDNIVVGNYITPSHNSGKLASTASDTALDTCAFVGRVVQVKPQGNEYYVGENVNLRVRKVVIEVIQNG